MSGGHYLPNRVTVYGPVAEICVSVQNTKFQVPSQVQVNVWKSVELRAESTDRQISTLSGLIIGAQDRAYVGTDMFLSSLRHHQLEINSLWRVLRLVMK